MVHDDINISVINRGERYLNFMRPPPKFVLPYEESKVIPFAFTHAMPNIRDEFMPKNLEEFFNPVDSSRADILVFDEAVSKVFSVMSRLMPVSSMIPVESAMWCLKYRTSPGFPYCAVYKTKSDVLADPVEMMKIISRARSYLSGATDLVPIWYVFPKNEVISISKCNNNEFRTIQCPPVDALLAYAACFDDQNRNFVATGLFCVGDVIEYGGFTDFVKAHLMYYYFLEVDGRKFDRRLCRLIMHAIRMIRRNLHSSPSVVDQLYEFIINSYFIDGLGRVYAKDHGNPSGSFNTIIDNCIATLIIVAYVVTRCGYDFSEWFKNCRVDILGDDLLISMSAEFVITYEEIQKYALELGTEYELARESNNIVGHSFYGKTVCWSDEFNTYVGEPQWEKLNAQLCYLPFDCKECQIVVEAMYTHYWVNKQYRLKFSAFVDDLSKVRGYNFKLPSDAFVSNLVFGMVVGGKGSNQEPQGNQTVRARLGSCEFEEMYGPGFKSKFIGMSNGHEQYRESRPGEYRIASYHPRKTGFWASIEPDMRESGQPWQRLVPVVPPSPPLVGVEENPGPPKRTSKQRQRSKPRGRRLAEPVKGLKSYVRKQARGDMLRIDNSIKTQSSVPVSYSNSITMPFAKPVRLAGREFLSTVTSSTSVSALLYTFNLNPITIGLSNLFTQAATYEKYRYRKLVIHYIPGLTTSLSGSFIGYVDKDPGAPSTYSMSANQTGNQAIRIASSHEGSCTNNVWCGAKYAMRPDNNWLFVDPSGSDIRLSSSGIFYLIQNVATTAADSCGSLYIEYDIEFLGKQLNCLSDPASVKLTAVTPSRVTDGSSDYVDAASWTAGNDAEDNLFIYASVASSLGTGFVIPYGQYFVEVQITGVGLSTVSVTTTTDAQLTTTIPVAFVNAAATQEWFNFTVLNSGPNVTPGGVSSATNNQFWLNVQATSYTTVVVFFIRMPFSPGATAAEAPSLTAKVPRAVCNSSSSSSQTDDDDSLSLCSAMNLEGPQSVDFSKLTVDEYKLLNKVMKKASCASLVIKQ